MYLALNANPCNPNSKLLRLSFEIFSHASGSRHQHWFGERGCASHAVLSPLLIQVFFAAGWQQLLAVLLAWLHHCRPLFSNHCEKQRAPREQNDVRSYVPVIVIYDYEPDNKAIGQYYRTHSLTPYDSREVHLGFWLTLLCSHRYTSALFFL